jgi:hypothetical protein
VEVSPTLRDSGSPNRLTASFVDAHLRGFDCFFFDDYLRVFGLIKPTAFWLGEFLLGKSDIIPLRFQLVK